MKRINFITITVFAVFISSLFTACANINTEKNYYYKEYASKDGIDIEFYGKGYGTYGQLITNYCKGDIESILEEDKSITITTSINDNNMASANEIYINLTLNKHCKALLTDFATGDKSVISSFRIYYTTPDGNEVTVASTFTESKEYEIDADIDVLTLFVRQNKYFSSYHKDESLRNQPSRNPFTIKLFLPTFN